MTSKKAIEILCELIRSDDIDITPDEKDALRLGIEALVRETAAMEIKP